MSIRFVRLSVLGVIVLFASGCITKRTVTHDGEVVEEGYVVKTPRVKVVGDP